MTEEEFKDKVQKRLDLGKNVTIPVKKGKDVKGVLDHFRKMFPNNFVYKDTGYGDGTHYVICAGDKEENKEMWKEWNTPICRTTHKSIRKQLLEAIDKYEQNKKK